MTDIQDLILAEIQTMNGLLAQLRDRTVSGSQVQVVSGVSEISPRLGLMMAGELRSGNGADPGKGFSGVRIAYPPMTYNSEDWNIVGVENDVLQVGIRSSDGVLIAGGGAVRLDSEGIKIDSDSIAHLSFENPADTYSNVFIQSLTATSSLVLENRIADGGGVFLGVRAGGNPTQTRYMQITADGDVSDQIALYVPNGPAGGQISLYNTSGAVLSGLYGEQGANGSNRLFLKESSNTPPSPTADVEANLYVKSDKLVVQFNDGGTVRYYTVDLGGAADSQWIHSTSAP